MRVTVFGGSKPKPGEPAYEEALTLGRLLGAAGYTVLTGGYIGTMEAVSRGAAESGGYVIGVTCAEIESWRGIAPNPWVQEEIRRATLNERLRTLIESCDAAIALPGGIGTLTEISLMWSQMQIRALPPRPLLLVGEGWQRTFEAFFASQSEYIAPADRALLTFVPDAPRAAALVGNG